MKTISELEAEVAELKVQEANLWAQVREHSKVLDAITKPWCDIGTKIRVMETKIAVLKEMEAAQ